MTLPGLRRGLPILGLLFVLSACDDPSADALIERAEDSRQKGDISASIIDLRNALQKEPKNARARYLLGRNHLAIGDLESAEKEFLRARDFGTSMEQLAAPLAEIWLARRQFVKILEQLRLGQVTSERSKVSVSIAHGWARQGLGDAAAAEGDFETALAIDPGSVPALVGLARIAMQLGRDREAESAVARAVAAAPEDSSVVSLKGDHDFGRGDFASAAAQYRKILDAGGDSLAVRLALARAQIYLGETDRARVNIDKVLERAEGHVDANYLRASLAFEAKDYEAAKQHSEWVVLVVPDHLPSLLIAGASNYLLGRLEKANRYLSAVLAKDPEHRLASRLYAATRARLARARDGRAGLTPLLDDSLEPRELVVLVDPEARARADFEAGQAYFAGLSETYAEALLAAPPGPAGQAGEAPRDAERLARLAKLEHRAGNGREALSLLERAIAAAPYAVTPRALLGQVQLQAGRPAKAFAAIEIVLRADPEHPVLLGLAGLARLFQGRPSDAKLAFRSLVEVRPDDPWAQYLLALAYRDEGDAARHRERLEQVLRREPGNLRARIEIARLLVSREGPGAAAELLDELRRIAPDDPRVSELIGAIAVMEGRPDDAVEHLRRAAARAPSATAALKLAFVQQRAGDGQGSRATLVGWLEGNPGDVDVRLALANKHLAAGGLEAAKSHYTKIIIRVPGHVVALNNLAWTNLRLGDSEAALEQIERAYQLAPEDPRVIDTLGLAQLRAGNPEAATSALRRAAKRMPDDPGVQGHLARALAQLGADGVAEAREILRRILARDVEFPEKQAAEALLEELGG